MDNFTIEELNFIAKCIEKCIENDIKEFSQKETPFIGEATTIARKVENISFGLSDYVVVLKKIGTLVLQNMMAKNNKKD